MARTLLTVAVVWLLGSWISSIHPIPWMWWALLSALGCVVVTIHPSGRWQAVIGGSFLATLVAHIAFGLSVIMVRNVSVPSYLNALDRLNIIRVALCGAWVCAALVRAWLLPHHRAGIARASLAKLD